MSKIADLIDQLECLLEQADSNYELKQKIRNATPTIFKHIFKILVYGEENKTDVHHWAAEVLASLRPLCFIKSKTNKKVLTTKQIINIMVSRYTDYEELYEIVGECYTEFNEYIPNIDIEVIYDRILNIIYNLIQYIKSTPTQKVNEIERIIN